MEAKELIRAETNRRLDELDMLVAFLPTTEQAAAHRALCWLHDVIAHAGFAGEPDRE